MEKFISTIVQLLLISLPQNLSIMINIYALNKRKLGGKKFWICILITLTVISLIRILPISFGIHTLLGMVLIIFLCVYYIKFPIKTTITAVFVSCILIVMMEILNMKVLTEVYGETGFEEIMANDLTNTIAGIPSSIALLLVTAIIYKVKTKKIKRDEVNGKNITQDS